jgi:hypothetical protein
MIKINWSRICFTLLKSTKDESESLPDDESLQEQVETEEVNEKEDELEKNKKFRTGRRKSKRARPRI